MREMEFTINLRKLDKGPILLYACLAPRRRSFHRGLRRSLEISNHNLWKGGPLLEGLT